MRRNYLLASILFIAAMLLSTLPINDRSVRAQAPPPLPFQYAVKLVCGRATGQQQVVARGRYFTAINVHNPFVNTVEFRWKLAVTFPKNDADVSQFFSAKLGPDQALELDCGDIFEILRRPFIEGFAVIESKTELDVVAVYTAAGASRQVETMHLERVPPRRFSPQGLPDLIPFPDSSGNFCRLDRARRLIVTVKNQGTVDAGPSETKVSFNGGGIVSVPTPAIPAGGSVEVLVPIPANCFSPDCGFRITVDSAFQIVESNELNNTVSGNCIA